MSGSAATAPTVTTPGQPRVGGLTPFTTIDFPGQLATVVYLQGCPWRCRYCHNGHLLDSGGAAEIGWGEVMEFLRQRRGLLDAVVFSGGEPTAQSALPRAVQQVRDLGFRIGLHTSGSYPRRLARLLPALDWVGLDIKALPEDYAALTGVEDSGERAYRSLRLLLDSGVSHEVRVTVHERLLPPSKLQRLLELLRGSGVAEQVLQRCRSEDMLDPSLGPNRQSGLSEQRCTAAQWQAVPSARQREDVLST